jgi:hypothetical protein
MEVHAGSHTDTCRWTDMTKLIGAFHNYANTPKKTVLSFNLMTVY